MWMIWFSLVCSIIFYQFKLGGGMLRGNDARTAIQNPIVWLCVVWLLGAAVVRWLLIPKTKNYQRLLILMIIGLALSESVTLHSIFLFRGDMPKIKMSLFVLSLLSALQFIPVYAKDLEQEKNG